MIIIFVGCVPNVPYHEAHIFIFMLAHQDENVYHRSGDKWCDKAKKLMRNESNGAWFFECFRKSKTRRQCTMGLEYDCCHNFIIGNVTFCEKI